MSESDWDALVGRIYDAALCPETWADVLLSIGRPINAHGGQLVVIASNAETAYDSVLAGVELPRAQNEFQYLVEHGHHVRADCASKLPEMSMFADHTHTSRLDMKHSLFYQEHAFPLEVPYYGAAVIKRSTDVFIVYGVFRSRRAGHMDKQGLEYLRRLAPHIRRSVELSLRLPAEGVADCAGPILESIDCGAVLIDSRMCISAANVAASRMLGAGDGLSTTNMRLSTIDSVASRRLTSELRNALGFEHSARLTGSGRIEAGRLSGKSPYTLYVARLNKNPRNFRERFCLVLIVDPDAKFKLPLEFLQEEFQLTPAEGDVVAHLAGGRSITDIAAIRHSSVETVRSQLKNAMAKIGTNRQAELVSRLVRAHPAWMQATSTRMN